MSQPAFALERAIPSDVQLIEGIVAEVAAGCADFDYSPKVVRLNLCVALTEVLANAIISGNHEDHGKFVRVRVHVDDISLVVEVADEGPGFDLDSCTHDPTTPDRISLEDGRGLFMTRRLVDRVEQFNDGHNVVRLTMRRT